MGERSENRESPTGKGAKKRTLRRMDSRNKASVLNRNGKCNCGVIDTVVTDHFEMLVRDMDNEPLNEFDRGNGFDNEFVVFVSVVMEGNMGAGIRIDTGSSNDRPAEIAANVFRDDRRIAVIGLGVNIEAFAVILINSGFDFFERGTELGVETIKEGGTEGIA